HLPDLVDEFAHFNIQSQLARGTEHIEIHETIIKGNGKEETDLSRIERRYAINGVTQPEQEYFINLYTAKKTPINVTGRTSTSIMFSIRHGVGEQLYTPDIVEDVSGNKFFVPNPDNYILEPASLHIVLFCFGMLARYYADIWMKAVDEQVQITEVIDTFL